MGQRNQNWDKILELMFEYPNQKFSVREISKKIKIPSSSVQRYIQELKKQKLVDKNNKLIINQYSKFLKTFFIIKKMLDIGLIDYIEKALVPETIILFGGARKGEYDHESDIDIFIATTKKYPKEGHKQKLDLKKFEKILNHKIDLFINKDIQELPDNLFNNVINGIKLRGYFKIK